MHGTKGMHLIFALSDKSEGQGPDGQGQGLTIKAKVKDNNTGLWHVYAA